MHHTINTQEASLVTDQCHDVRLEDQVTSPVKSALYHPSGHPLNNVQLVPRHDSSDCLIIRDANSIEIPNLGHDGMPQHAEDQGRIPPQVLASSMMIFPSLIEDIGIVLLHQ